MDIKNMPIEAIIPYSKNTKKHDDVQINNVAESIKQYGFVQPIVIDKNNVVVIGHCRLLAAKKLNMTDVPCVCVDDLTEEQVRKLRIIDNKSNESDWDFDFLNEELLDLDFSDFNFDFGIDTDAEEEIEIVEDESPEVDEENEPITKLGDIWQLGRHRLMCGNSFNASDVAKLCECSVDTILYDPPFDNEQFYKDICRPQDGQSILVFCDYKHWGAAVKGAMDAGWNPLFEFIWNNIQSWYTENRPLAQHKTCYVFGDQKKWNFDKAIINDDVKRKKSHCKSAAGRGEYDYVPLKNGKHLSTVFDYSNTSLHDEHGQGKPVKWISAILNGLDAKIVLDLFSGSGTGIISCEQTGKTCLAMEIEPKYCDQAVKRWENLTSQKAKKV